MPKTTQEKRQVAYDNVIKRIYNIKEQITDYERTIKECQQYIDSGFWLKWKETYDRLNMHKKWIISLNKNLSYLYTHKDRLEKLGCK